MFRYSLPPFSFLGLNALRPFKLTPWTFPYGLTFPALAISCCSPLEGLHLLDASSMTFPDIGHSGLDRSATALCARWQVTCSLSRGVGSLHS